MRSWIKFRAGPLMLLIGSLVVFSGSRGFLFIPSDGWLGPAVSLVLLGGAVLTWLQISDDGTPPRVKASSRFFMAMAGWGVVEALPLGGWWAFLQQMAALFLIFVVLRESRGLRTPPAPDSNGALPTTAPGRPNSISIWIGFALIVVACAIPLFPGDYDFGVDARYIPVLHLLAIALGIIGVGLIFSYAYMKNWRTGSGRRST